MTDRFLIDTSALARFPRPPVRAMVQPLHNAGLLAVCGAVEVEALRSAHSRADERIRDEMRGFDMIARVTGQPVRWVAAAGSAA
ncbi:hypothetical protein ACFYXS_17940 [Streptomyces sp. NPDC002574]|uniref:hypothetical protein n=1 Tax=Streptomyces sp. NPDC002574 TaxID=3364652 RepID=UPI003692BCBA